MQPSLTAIKIRIETSRLEETVGFYESVIGLRPVDRWHDGSDRGAILGVSDLEGHGFLEIGYAANPEPVGNVSLQIRTVDLRGFADRVRGLWEFQGPETHACGGTYLYLSDPNGIPVVVFEGDV